MIFFLIAVLAGVLTILSPCILPLLPVVIGSSVSPGISRRTVTVVLSLSASVMIFTLLLKSTTFFINIPEVFWMWFSGGIIMMVGMALLFPRVWNKAPFVGRFYAASSKKLAEGYKASSVRGDIVMGAALGPVFTSCSPTYFFILGTVLPARMAVGIWYLFGFVLGLTIALFMVAYVGQKLINVILSKQVSIDRIKTFFGILFLILGILIVTGYDKKISTYILDAGYGATIHFEQNLIDRVQSFREIPGLNSENTPSSDIPSFLRRSFPETDWTQYDPRLGLALSGGPNKDGIPSIDEPQFEDINDFKHSDNVQAIVLQDGNTVKAYPYNILVWHEIVNDTVDGVPVAVTFCPLCGSAIVFNRDLPDGASYFGVSGGLLESNMIMYDRQTESLWLQSTGQALAGRYFGRRLELVPFQLLTIGEIKERHENAKVLSEDTGYRRDYARNPYAGYEDSEEVMFRVSFNDTRHHPKEIMVVFWVDDVSVAVPWLQVKNDKVHGIQAGGRELFLHKKDGELAITDSSGREIPFYFEMWFSWAAQHRHAGVAVDLE